MANALLAYGTPTAITITLGNGSVGLASSATDGREGTSVSNASDLFIDALLWVKVKGTNSGSVANDKAVLVYVYSTSDEGSPEYPDVVTGSDANITPTNFQHLRLGGKVFFAANNTTYKNGGFSVASAFGGVLPKRWGVVVRNYTGIALSITGADHRVHYQGVYTTIV